MAFGTLDYWKYKFPYDSISVSVSELYPFKVSEWLEWLEGMGGNKGSKLVQKVEKMNLNGGGGDQTDGCFPR